MPQDPSLINAYFPIEGRTLELRFGDYFKLNLHTDLLVISAWDGFYEPEDGTMIKALEKSCGIRVKDLARAYDFTLIPSLKAWISEELDPDAARSSGFSHFRRLVVVESPRVDPENNGQSDDGESGARSIPVFQQMFRLLALLPLYEISCRTVATPILNTGGQGAKLNQLIDNLRHSIRTGFENVPELKQMVIFDIRREPMEELNNALNDHLQRPDIQSKRIANDEELGFDSKTLKAELRRLRKRAEFKSSEDIHPIFADIQHELDASEISLVTIGISARKLIEILVTARTSKEGLGDASLYRRINYLEPSISPWIANALHGVRIFGNWMGHADLDGTGSLPSREVSRHDLTIMLQQLQCVVAHYPWSASRRRRLPLPLKRVHSKLDNLG